MPNRLIREGRAAGLVTATWSREYVATGPGRLEIYLACELEVLFEQWPRQMERPLQFQLQGRLGARTSLVASVLRFVGLWAIGRVLKSRKPDSRRPWALLVFAFRYRVVHQVTWPIYVYVHSGKLAAVQLFHRNVGGELLGTAPLVQVALNVCLVVGVSVWRGGGVHVDVWVCVSTIPSYADTSRRVRLPVLTVYISERRSGVTVHAPPLVWCAVNMCVHVHACVGVGIFLCGRVGVCLRS